VNVRGLGSLLAKTYATLTYPALFNKGLIDVFLRNLQVSSTVLQVLVLKIHPASIPRCSYFVLAF